MEMAWITLLAVKRCIIIVAVVRQETVSSSEAARRERGLEQEGKPNEHRRQPVEANRWNEDLSCIICSIVSPIFSVEHVVVPQCSYVSRTWPKNGSIGGRTTPRCNSHSPIAAPIAPLHREKRAGVALEHAPILALLRDPSRVQARESRIVPYMEPSHVNCTSPPPPHPPPPHAPSGWLTPT